MTDPIDILLAKYDVATPRYTSYPTVPYWDFSNLDTAIWKQSVVDSFKSENGELSIYIHLPFCESLCTFCACNKRITKNHSVENPYIDTVIKEWKMYRDILPGRPAIKEIHLGGGTPTFFTPDNLVHLIKNITEGTTICDNHEFSVEIHPNSATEEHLKKLAEIGFNRLSIGVQDLNPQIQFLINRNQTFEKTKTVFEWAREYNYKSINVDLIYGLPQQTVQSVEHTIELIGQLMPDRIAFYSYAHVPWKSKAQRRYTEADLPNADVKWEIYNCGRTLLEQAGFESIGMDHFALKNDPLFIASANGKLHRNFMGYTTTSSKLIIGLGASSISATKDAYAQNEKVIEAYEKIINGGELALINGRSLDKEDLVIQHYIHELMCLNETTIHEERHTPDYIESMQLKLLNLETDGLVTVHGNVIHVTPMGKMFIRNICAAVDAYLFRKEITGQTFSRAI